MEAGDERATYQAGQVGPTNRTYGMNWKHTAKTTLIQLHSDFRAIGKHLVLVIQDRLLMYLMAHSTSVPSVQPDRAIRCTSTPTSWSPQKTRFFLADALPAAA